METTVSDSAPTAAASMLDRVRERDLDLMMAEEFYCSENFRRFILEQSGESPSHSLVRVRVSEVTDTGESDVLLVVKTGSSRIVALMVEHKINAIFQPAQSERYIERGKDGLRKGQWDTFRTVLCGPNDYVEPLENLSKWNACLPLERIAAFWRSQNKVRGEFLASVYEQAVRKYADRAREISPLATEFWGRYRERVRTLLPTLTVSRLPELISEASPWPRFSGPSLPLGPLLEHKPQQGWVDLTFPNTAMDKLKNALPVSWPSDVTCVSAGRSAALRIKVDRINHLLPFDDQGARVDIALRSVQRLLDLSGSIPTILLAPKDGASGLPEIAT